MKVLVFDTGVIAEASRLLDSDKNLRWNFFAVSYIWKFCTVTTFFSTTLKNESPFLILKVQNSKSKHSKVHNLDNGVGPVNWKIALVNYTFFKMEKFNFSFDRTRLIFDFFKWYCRSKFWSINWLSHWKGTLLWFIILDSFQVWKIFCLFS